MDWIKRLKSSISAFDEFYAETKKSVFYAIYPVVKDADTTEDLMQEVYLDFLNKYKSYKDDLNVVPFLITSAKNKAINYYNSNKRRIEFEENCRPFSYSNDKYLDTGLLKVVKQTLTNEEFEVFVLKVLGEYTFKEISKVKNIPIGTLTWIYQNCRQKLQTKLKGVSFNE